MAKGKARLSCGSPLIAIASARWISKLGALGAEATPYFSTAQSSRKRNLTFILHNKFTGEKKKSIFVFQPEVLSKEKPGHNIYKIKIQDNFSKMIKTSEIFTFPAFSYSNTGIKSDSLSASTLFWNKDWC